MITALVRADPADLARAADRIAAGAARVLAVGAGPEEAMELIGFVALHDPPRPDSKALIGRLRDLGIRVMTLTGDNSATARAVAAEVGIGGRLGDVEYDCRAGLSTTISSRGSCPRGSFASSRPCSGPATSSG